MAKRADAKALRARAGRRSHGEWTPAAARRDPVAILRAADAVRVPELVAIRYQRMLASPFAFYRGAAAIMAADLHDTPVTGLVTQICGDAHPANFGLFATPERRLVFSVNDFDETLPGPWEWDCKRLVAGLVVAARAAGTSESRARRVATTATAEYRTRMAEYASMSALARLVLDSRCARVRAADAAFGYGRAQSRGRTSSPAPQPARGREAHRAGRRWLPVPSCTAAAVPVGRGSCGARGSRGGAAVHTGSRCAKSIIS